VTSRSLLNLSGERQYLLAPVGLPEAVDLFIERAGAPESGIPAR
jgi:predicted ATPase